MHTVASRPVNLGPDQPEGWSWMADTTVTHQPATESTDRTPISEIGGHLAESRGAILKGIRGLTFGETGNHREHCPAPRPAGDRRGAQPYRPGPDRQHHPAATAGRPESTGPGSTTRLAYTGSGEPRGEAVL